MKQQSFAASCWASNNLSVQISTLPTLRIAQKGLPIEQVKSVLSGLSETVLRAMKLRTMCSAIPEGAAEA